MKIRVTSAFSGTYVFVNKIYGNVLKHFNLENVDGKAFIELNSLKDIERLDICIADYYKHNSGQSIVLDSALYRGVRFSHDENLNFVLQIQDHADCRI